MSTKSPTPSWSSTSRKTPDTRSLTMLCTPNATVTATTEVPATIVVMLKPSSARTISAVTTVITKVTALRASEPRAPIRCSRRSAGSVVASTRA